MGVGMYLIEKNKQDICKQIGCLDVGRVFSIVMIKVERHSNLFAPLHRLS